MDSINILGVKVNMGQTMNSVVSIIENEFLHDNKTRYICTTNPEFIMLAREDPEFKKIINDSDLSLPDGVGVIQAVEYISETKTIPRNFLFPLIGLYKGIRIGLSSLFNTNIKSQKIKGVDLTYKLCELAEKKKFNVFLLGGRRKDKRGNWVDYDIDLANLAAKRLLEIYPKLNIIGATSKYDRNQSDDEKTIQYVHDCMKQHGVTYIDFLFVAYDQGYQEKWIVRNKDKIPAKISVGVGGTIDYISQNTKYVPNAVNNMNLEWLYKLVTQPWRFKRIANAFPTFPIQVYLHSLRNH